MWVLALSILLVKLESRKKVMIDSVKTIANGIVGVGVWWLNLPMVLQMCVSVATLVYIIIKIRKELQS